MVCYAAGFPAHALGAPVLGYRKNAILQQPNPEIESASMRKPAFREIISDSVELSETEVFFVTHPTYGNKRVTAKDAQDSSPKSILSLQDFLQNQSLGTVPVCTVVRYFPHDNVA